jgi:hypothetical protein
MAKIDPKEVETLRAKADLGRRALRNPDPGTGKTETQHQAEDARVALQRDRDSKANEL